MELSRQLHAEQIGAVVVSDDGRSIAGIISERDLAYALGVHGSELSKIVVSKLMTRELLSVGQDTITDVMKLMTQQRIRHTYPSKTAINWWGSLASATYSSTGSARWNWRPTCCAITPSLLDVSSSLQLLISSYRKLKRHRRSAGRAAAVSGVVLSLG